MMRVASKPRRCNETGTLSASLIAISRSVAWDSSPDHLDTTLVKLFGKIDPQRQDLLEIA